MKTVIKIQRYKKDPDLWEYVIKNHRIVIFRVQSAMPMYPWRISIDHSVQNTHFMNQVNAENYLISYLSGLEEYSNNIFSIFGDSSTGGTISCECGKEKHNFFKHSDWCPKSK